MSDADRIFTDRVIQALRDAGVEILTAHGGWGDIVIEFKQGTINRIYLDGLAVYVRSKRDCGE